MNVANTTWVQRLAAAREFDPRAEAELVQRWLTSAPPNVFAAALNSRDAGLFLAMKLDAIEPRPMTLATRLRTAVLRWRHRHIEDAIAANNELAARGSTLAIKTNAHDATKLRALGDRLRALGVPQPDWSMGTRELVLWTSAPGFAFFCIALLVAVQ